MFLVSDVTLQEKYLSIRQIVEFQYRLVRLTRIMEDMA